jgi:Trk K+ transport system NAD-binding subunit
MSSAAIATLVSLVVVLALTLGAALLYREENPDLSWFDAINVAVVLAVGGFDNVFGALKEPFAISPWLYAYSLLMKISSAVFLGIVFASFTEKVLGARFAIAARRPEAPAEQHTVIVGLGPIGQNVALQLKQWGRAAVGVTPEPPGEDFLRDMPIEAGATRHALERANVATARSVVVAGDDQVANLECMLLARSLNPRCALVFRVGDRELAANISALIPDSLGINDWEVAAQAIAGAAFGESILSAFRLPGRSILVTRYRIEAGDTLNGWQLAHMAYGYGVVPVLHERGPVSALNPSDDIRLEIGDGLVVLATIEALGRIERGELRPPARRLMLQACAIAASAFEAGNVIARIAGCDLATARKALENLPRELETPVYRPQGLRLARELQKLGVIATLVETE